MNKCEDDEVVSDLSHSAESLRESLKKDGIELIYQKDSNKCGYEFKNNNKSKMLEGAMTDVELYSEIKFFFNLGS